MSQTEPLTPVQISPKPLNHAFFVKVTVQFETKGNGQNEIVSHMDSRGKASK